MSTHKKNLFYILPIISKSKEKPNDLLDAGTHFFPPYRTSVQSAYTAGDDVVEICNI